MADASLGTAVLRTRLDQAGLTSGLNNLRRETDTTLGSIERRLEATGRRLRGIGTGLTIGVTTPLAILGGAAIKAASDAEETRSKFRTVFRDIGDDAQDAADRLSTAFGQSDRAAQAFLANTGDLLTGFGFTQEAALDLSQQVNELAIDLASFTNFSGGAEGASQALTSALLGEREAAKSLGIAITEDVVQAKLDELRATGDLIGQTEKQQEAYATLLIAQEQSANAIGDFARTQDSFANQTRILSSNLDDLRVALGEGILPLVTPVVGGLADIAAGFADMSDGARNAVLIIGGGAAAAGPLLLGLGTIVSLAPKVVVGLNSIRNAMLFLGPGGLIAGGITLIAGLAVALSGRSDSLDATLGEAKDALGTSGDKDSLVGGLEDLRSEIDGPVGRALDDLIERVDSSKTSFEEAKAAADAFFDSANRSNAARLEALEREEAQLQALLDQYQGQDPTSNSFVLGNRDIDAEIRELEAAGQRILEESPVEASTVGTEAFTQLEEIRKQLQTLRLEADGVAAAVFSPEDRARVTSDLQRVRQEIRTLRTELGIAAPAVTGTPGGGEDPPPPLRPPPSLDERTVADVFNDLAEAGTRAEQRSTALGDTIETRLDSVETRARLVSGAIDELFELGLTAADDKVKFLVERLEDLERQARILRRGSPTPDAGLLQGGGTPGDRVFPNADRFPQRLERSGDGGLAQLVQIANVNELRTALAGQQINRPTLRESREALGTLGIAEVLRTLNLPGSEGDTDQAVSEGELIARQAELSFDEYLAAMPDAATDLSLSAEELTRAAARLDLDRRTSAVLGVLGRAQADTIRTGRRPGQLGPFTADFGEPDLGFTGTPFVDRGVEGVAPIFDPEIFTREFIAAGEQFRQEAVEGGVQTAKQLIGAGDRFVGAIGAFAQGNIGSGVSGLGQTAGGILNAIPGLGLVGSLVGAGAGLLGGIINLFGGGNDRTDAQADSARRARNLSTLELNFRLDQQNIFQGGIADPATEQALNRQADAMFTRVEDLIRRAILPDIRALKERTGLA